MTLPAGMACVPSAPSRYEETSGSASVRPSAENAPAFVNGKPQAAFAAVTSTKPLAQSLSAARAAVNGSTMLPAANRASNTGDRRRDSIPSPSSGPPPLDCNSNSKQKHEQTLYVLCFLVNCFFCIISRIRGLNAISNPPSGRDQFRVERLPDMPLVGILSSAVFLQLLGAAEARRVAALLCGNSARQSSCSAASAEQRRLCPDEFNAFTGNRLRLFRIGITA